MVALSATARARGPLVVWVAGIACFAFGAIATTTYVDSNDLYVDAQGDVCNGGSMLAVCYGIDRLAFQPPAPDLSSFQSHGFGIDEPARVPGGTIYVSRYLGRCQVEAIQLDGRLSARSGFRMLSAIENFAWGLPVGVALLIVAGVLYSMRRSVSPRLRVAILASVTAEVGLAGLYVLVTFIFMAGPLAMPSAAAFALTIAFILMALIGCSVAIAITLKLALRREPGGGFKVAVTQTGGALAVLFGLVTVSVLSVTQSWC